MLVGIIGFQTKAIIDRCCFCFIDSAVLLLDMAEFLLTELGGKKLVYLGCRSIQNGEFGLKTHWRYKRKTICKRKAYTTLGAANGDDATVVHDHSHDAEATKSATS
jgi:hypothetical protein